MSKIAEASQYLKSKIKSRPKTGIILGSGLGDFINSLERTQSLKYQEIPHFNSTTVPGHAGQFIAGELEQVPLAVMQGRFHAYEGLSMEEVVLPIRVLFSLGVETVILTNAAGGINENFRPGDLVLIRDHLNLSGRNPLVGPNLSQLGPRFPDMSETYHPQLRELALSVAQEQKIPLREGVYGGVLGPCYETPAEIRMLRTLGADMVGMSTVAEAIAGAHMGLKILGISCITNMGAGMEAIKLNHEDVKLQAEKAMEKFSRLLFHFIRRLQYNTDYVK